MRGSLRTVTYNVQCRSWAMEALADMSIPPSETSAERAELISHNLLNSNRDYDVVCLNEVFDEDSRAIFADKLTTRWPYAIVKADFFTVDIALPGTPTLAINPVALLLDYSGLALLGSFFATGTPKLEDSGLMLFSRFPFVRTPISGSVASHLSTLVLGELAALGIPTVGFRPYMSARGNDALAAKGLLYAAIAHPSGDVVHVCASHTQADSDIVSENEFVRRDQLAEAAHFIDEVTSATPGALTLAMGDFNVCGGQETVPADQFTKEWRSRFSDSGDLWSARLTDVWGREQCVGAGPTGLRDPGPSANVAYPPAEQRLDYLFRTPTSSIVAQHLFIDHDLAAVPPGVDGVSYLSDHRPLGCDLFERQADNSPNRAVPAVADPTYIDDNELNPGQVRWYRFDRHGTYDLHVLNAFERVAYEVYLDTDISLPRQPYREEVDEERGTKFVLASAPFLVKVFCHQREQGAGYRFIAHRHDGSSPQEAIDIVPGVQYHEQFPAGQVLNIDQPVAPGDDTDSKWFVIDTPRIPVDDPIKLSLRVTPVDHASDGARVSVFADTGDPPLTAVTLSAPSTESTLLEWEAADNERYFVAVQRVQTGGNPLSFDLHMNWTVTMLLGGLWGRPHLMCIEETSGWGSDDIALRLTADGEVVRFISNDKIGDFDGEDVRDLAQWLPPHTVYSSGYEVTVIEEDDIDADDIGRRTIPVLESGQLAVGEIAPGVAITSVSPDSSARVTAVVNVDDGTYEFRCRLARWHEQA